MASMGDRAWELLLAKDNHGCTPLHSAAAYSCRFVVDSLIAHGRRLVRHRNCSGISQLLLAILSDLAACNQVVQPPSQPDNSSISPSYQETGLGTQAVRHTPLTVLVLTQGCLANMLAERDKNGKTPWLCAAAGKARGDEQTGWWTECHKTLAYLRMVLL
jgi:ankyrin repeat protein